ncbi:MAG: sigma-70 family RNA polymerase sigma factor, partial [Novosphingobium sp.]|nr:sigma-70 family RNA polymerase sigma factor [Novosphingobium sp.]
MKPAMRETAALVAGQQLTHAEAAAVLGISEATVSWRMHEIRKVLGGTTR